MQMHTGGKHISLQNEAEELNAGEGPPEGQPLGTDRALVRVSKSVVMRNDDSVEMNDHMISPLLYNSFQYSLLPRNEARTNFVFGVTSTRDGDGKTLVAANLAVSLALADERETVVVDLNLRRPQLHSVFALTIGPGLAEALNAPMVHVARTTVRHLHVMTLGNLSATFSGLRDNGNGSPNGRKNGRKNGKQDGKRGEGAGSSAVSGMPSFRHVMDSLKQRFEVIIFDMPSIGDPILPLHLTRQMDGVIFVVDGRRTTKDDVTRSARRIGKDHILGFVLNRGQEEA